MTQPSTSRPKNESNGRSVRNAPERARLRQATRIVRDNNHNLSRTDLMRIEAEDILASRVFDDENDENDGNGNGNGNGDANESAREEPDLKVVE